MTLAADILEIFADASYQASPEAYAYDAVCASGEIPDDRIVARMLFKARVMRDVRAPKECKTPGCTNKRRRINRAEHCWDCYRNRLIVPGRVKPYPPSRTGSRVGYWNAGGRLSKLGWRERLAALGIDDSVTSAT